MDPYEHREGFGGLLSRNRDVEVSTFQLVILDGWSVLARDGEVSVDIVGRDLMTLRTIFGAVKRRCWKGGLPRLFESFRDCRIRNIAVVRYGLCEASIFVRSQIRYGGRGSHIR